MFVTGYPSHAIINFDGLIFFFHVIVSLAFDVPSDSCMDGKVDG
jgi:hypothetical protein